MAFSMLEMVVLGIFMSIMLLVTVIGNLLVILAFVTDEPLRTVSNYYLLNLAIADLLIGCFCIPVYIPYILTGEWTGGRPLCLIWLTVDYVVCTASTLNIMLISWDRYMLVTRGLSYHASQTTKKAIIHMAVVWVLATLLYGPAILFWERLAGRRLVLDNECFVEFYDNFPFKLTAAMVEFVTPLVSLSYFNVSIYLNIRWRSRGGFLTSERQKTCFGICGTSKTTTGSGSNEITANSSQNQRNTTHQSSLKRDKKTAKSLAILVGVFSLCWSPYTLLTLVLSLCPNCVNSHLYELAFWLLWLNSTVNPFIYQWCHKRFQYAFHKILCSWRKNRIHPSSTSPDNSN
ncbi:histamine H3 receptor-like [Ptychodera flava]|uniref:histamine H3 receptor-like n=1 Tax=Ptychodera flava TaxID=63121 RepID=UPI003969EF93